MRNLMWPLIIFNVLSFSLTTKGDEDPVHFYSFFVDFRGI